MENHMNILFLILVGIAAGFIATRMRGLEIGVLPTIAVGVLGAMIGGMILRGVAMAFGMLSGFVGAVLGALLLIWIYQKFVSRP
jgi:uncharacterized membrane protein YeaQ/YmgE (transglycosylase-associated protein family)